ncbi:hypothetical protein QE412_000214 [Microbacterium trichothecenolyticum]|uniref:Uncharacterized protein n=1 Tax=Microbacterium trichothecenolyticum TaxID=69370 RepID=A0ABU0TPN8_MICTR|nr:hypothetical protein [Microbacterium trichothecenolyticum]
MVAHDPDDACVEALGKRLDERAHAVVGVGFAEVGEVAGEDQGVGTHAGRVDGLDRSGQVRLGVDAVVERSTSRPKVGVAQVQQHMLGARVLGVTHLVPLGPSGTTS